MRTQWEAPFIDLVVKRYEEVKSTNPRHSMRWFAKTAGITSGAMSLILNRRDGWNLSWERSLIVLKNIKVDTTKINFFIIQTSPCIIVDDKLFSKSTKDFSHIDIDHAYAHDIDGVFFSGSSESLDQVKTEIHRFYHRLYAIANSCDKKNEIFYVRVGLKTLGLE